MVAGPALVHGQAVVHYARVAPEPGAEVATILLPNMGVVIVRGLLKIRSRVIQTSYANVSTKIVLSVRDFFVFEPNL